MYIYRRERTIDRLETSRYLVYITDYLSYYYYYYYYLLLLSAIVYFVLIETLSTLSSLLTTKNTTLSFTFTVDAQGRRSRGEVTHSG